MICGWYTTYIQQIVLALIIFIIVFVSNEIHLDPSIIAIISMPLIYLVIKGVEKVLKKCGVVVRDERDVYIDMWASSYTLKIGLIIGFISYVIGNMIDVKCLEYVLYYSLFLVFLRWLLLIIGKRKF